MVAVSLLSAACLSDPQPSTDTSAVATPAPSPSAGLLFEDVTADVGLPRRSTLTWGAAWADYDGDGWSDLLVDRHTRPAWLFHNAEGRFSVVEAPELTDPEPSRRFYDRHACSWGEANGDGRPDIICVAGARGGIGQVPNRLAIQTTRGFEDRAEVLGVDEPFARGRSATWFDHDGDGDLDLFFANETRDGYPNALFRNDRAKFTEVASGLETQLASVAASWADKDSDGDPDLLVLAHGSPGTKLFENTDGVFAEDHVEGISGAEWSAGTWADFDGDGWPDLHLVAADRWVLFRNVGGELRAHQRGPLRAGRMSAWLDVENDGDLDLFVVQGDPDGDASRAGNRSDLLLLQKGGRFVAVPESTIEGPRAGDGDAVAISDYDRDGRLDLLVTNGHVLDPGRLSLLRNLGATGNWVALRLDAGPWNPFGLGARVRARTVFGTQWREATDGFNFRSQSEPGYVHFGLGDAPRVRIKVFWPDGSTSCLDASANRAYTVSIGADACA